MIERRYPTIEKIYPSLDMRHLIEYAYHVYIPSNPNKSEKIIPRAKMELIFNFGSPFYIKHINEYVPCPRFFALGIYDKVHSVINAPMVNYISVVLTPGSLKKFTAEPIVKFISQVQALELVLSKKIHYLIKDIDPREHPSHTIQKIFDFISDLSLNEDGQVMWIDRVIREIHKYQGNISVRQLAKISGMTERNFRKVFFEQVGLNPKKYCEIIRMDLAMKALLGQKESIIDVCYNFEFFDLSHFNYAFKKIMKSSPSSFLEENNPISHLKYSYV